MRRSVVLLSGGRRSESDAAPGFLWRRHQHADGIEDYLELRIVFALHLVEAPRQISMGGENLSQLDKGAHDGDVDLDGAGGCEERWRAWLRPVR